MDRTIRTLTTLAAALFVGGAIAILSTADEPRGAGFIMLIAGAVCAVVALVHSVKADRKESGADEKPDEGSGPSQQADPE